MSSSGKNNNNKPRARKEHPTNPETALKKIKRDFDSLVTKVREAGAIDDDKEIKLLSSKLDEIVPIIEYIGNKRSKDLANADNEVKCAVERMRECARKYDAESDYLCQICLEFKPTCIEKLTSFPCHPDYKICRDCYSKVWKVPSTISYRVPKLKSRCPLCRRGYLKQWEVETKTKQESTTDLQTLDVEDPTKITRNQGDFSDDRLSPI